VQLTFRLAYLANSTDFLVKLRWELLARPELRDVACEENAAMDLCHVCDKRLPDGRRIKLAIDAEIRSGPGGKAHVEYHQFEATTRERAADRLNMFGDGGFCTRDKLFRDTEG